MNNDDKDREKNTDDREKKLDQLNKDIISLNKNVNKCIELIQESVKGKQVNKELSNIRDLNLKTFKNNSTEDKENKN